MSLVVLRIPPRRLLQRTPTLWRSSMNSPYCCLMEMGTQTNEQPLPGSAPRVLINPDAETLMALIFQTKRRLRLTASQRSHNKNEFQSETQPTGKEGVVFMSHLVCWARSLTVGDLPPQRPSVSVGKHKVKRAWWVRLCIKGMLRRDIIAHYGGDYRLQNAALISRKTRF